MLQYPKSDFKISANDVWRLLSTFCLLHSGCTCAQTTGTWRGKKKKKSLIKILRQKDVTNKYVLIKQLDKATPGNRKSSRNSLQLTANYWKVNQYFLTRSNATERNLIIVFFMKTQSFPFIRLRHSACKYTSKIRFFEIISFILYT